MPGQTALFPQGTRVQVKPLEFLQDFRQRRKDHDPLVDKQLSYAGAIARVRNIGFYYGGDVMYWLDDVPGTWHEECLQQPANSE